MAAMKEVMTRRSVAATIRLTLPAVAARSGPPVSPALGQYRLNLMAFCNDFNARTKKYKPDTPMAVTVTAYKDNTFEFIVKSPSVSWYLKKAAGVGKGTTRPGHLTVTKLSVRHVYEIAKEKVFEASNSLEMAIGAPEDNLDRLPAIPAQPVQYMPLESIYKSIIGTANSMGIKIVRDLE